MPWPSHPQPWSSTSSQFHISLHLTNHPTSQVENTRIREKRLEEGAEPKSPGYGSTGHPSPLQSGTPIIWGCSISSITTSDGAARSFVLLPLELDMWQRSLWAAWHPLTQLLLRRTICNNTWHCDYQSSLSLCTLFSWLSVCPLFLASQDPHALNLWSMRSTEIIC